MPIIENCAIIDKMSDTSGWPNTEYTISNQGLNVKTPVPGCSNIYINLITFQNMFLQKLLKHIYQN